VKVRPADADRFLAKPDPAVRVILIYGSDDGLVAERTGRFAAAVAGDARDPLSLTRLDMDAVADDPGILADEANAIPMFGGRRAILIKVAGQRSIEPALQAILAAPPVDSWIILAAGELRPTSPLRKLCEANAGAAAVACYADEAKDLDRLIAEEIGAAGLAIADDARAALKEVLGADRQVSRSELTKLRLYAEGGAAITVDDVRAVVGDASAFAVDETIDMMALGDGDGLDRGYRRLLAAGTSAATIAGTALRHFNFLEKSRARYDAGVSAEALVERAGPAIFYQRRQSVMRQIPIWPPGRLARAFAILDQAMVDSRLNGAIADIVIGHAFHRVAALAALAAAPASR
jgi:DNA polymerase-3 subunit delta